MTKSRFFPTQAVVLAVTLAFSGVTAGALDFEALEKATYAGSKSCEICHTEIYENWKSTLHTKKIQLANEYTVIGDFVTGNSLTVSKEGREYRTQMSKEKAGYFVETFGPGGEKKKYRITYTIGGTWKQRYITVLPDGAYAVLPVQWNVKTSEWVDYHGLKNREPGSGDYWSDPERIWQKKCGSCHVTGLEVEEDERGRLTTTWADEGTGCEACHGPGSRHLEANNEFERRETIINPGKLTVFNAVMVCGQCHSRGESPGGGYGYPKGFVPGKQLTGFYSMRPGRWPDGSSKRHRQQYNDWLTSAHADHGVICWQCHEVHKKGVTERYSLKAAGDALCFQCHLAAKVLEKGSFHGLHTVVSCTSCHMPRTAKSAVPNDIASHTFKVILPSTTLEEGGVEKQPNSCNLCHYHENDSPEALNRYIDKIKKEYYQ